MRIKRDYENLNENSEFIKKREKEIENTCRKRETKKV